MTAETETCGFGFAPNAVIDHETQCTLPRGHDGEHRLAETEKPFDALAWLRNVSLPDPHDEREVRYAKEHAAIAALIAAYRNLPLYQTDRNWSSDDPDDTVEICIGCGFPGIGDHDGDESCPVAVIEALSAHPREKQS